MGGVDSVESSAYPLSCRYGAHPTTHTINGIEQMFDMIPPVVDLWINRRLWITFAPLGSRRLDVYQRTGPLPAQPIDTGHRISTAT